MAALSRCPIAVSAGSAAMRRQIRPMKTRGGKGKCLWVEESEAGREEKGHCLWLSEEVAGRGREIRRLVGRRGISLGGGRRRQKQRLAVSRR